MGRGIGGNGDKQLVIINPARTSLMRLRATRLEVLDFPIASTCGSLGNQVRLAFFCGMEDHPAESTRTAFQTRPGSDHTRACCPSHDRAYHPERYSFPVRQIDDTLNFPPRAPNKKKKKRETNQI